MKTMCAILLAALPILPAAAQEPPADTATYRGAPVPVWIKVGATAKAGAPDVSVAVVWDDNRSKLRFASDMNEGDLEVLLPGAGGSCRFTNDALEFGAKGYYATKVASEECVSFSVTDISGVEAVHLGSPLACIETEREGGKVASGVRYFGCYWAAMPTKG